MSEEKVPREAVEETQREPATTDQPGAGSADSPREEDREKPERDQTGAH
ncbi:MAG: hypothetical protein J2P44_13055 [Candidatus Dormibacteraeota bacterium]|nr:hypothetical protein [Candidatus Dormibacteraeota bacterium]